MARPLGGNLAEAHKTKIKKAMRAKSRGDQYSALDPWTLELVHEGLYGAEVKDAGFSQTNVRVAAKTNRVRKANNQKPITCGGLIWIFAEKPIKKAKEE